MGKEVGWGGGGKIGCIENDTRICGSMGLFHLEQDVYEDSMDPLMNFSFSFCIKISHALL